MSHTLHVIPRDDLVEHETTDDCACGPSTKMVNRGDGSAAWIIVHASLDGRELRKKIEGRCGNCNAPTDELPCPHCSGVDS